MSDTAVPVKSAGRIYIIEVWTSGLLYAVAMWTRPWLIAHASDHALVVAATVLPALPIWLIFVAVWRYYLHIDEFQKHQFLQSLAISFGLGCSTLVTYSFLVDVGLPPLGISWAWPILGVVWLLSSIAIKRAYRR
ncbi:MAG TPA: hypothetical protein VMU22_15990 [Rhizomicrobium sp.]|nr:hypothetical protein [Rhizomicrobium sp.]